MRRYSLFHTLRYLYAGQSFARILMNYELARHTLRGRVLDVGGGRNPDYYAYLRRAGDVSVEVIDGALTGIDFEKDPLPYGNRHFDTVLLCNVLEHVYDHQFLLKEIRRVLASHGTLLGFVPFWTGYHPDPHDYFRYTAEALRRALFDAGFTNVDIRSVGRGPLLANFNTIVLSLPRFARPLAYCVYATFDALFVRLRPRSMERNPLGYQFNAHV
ncbi:TPA: hypothetical protein DIV48_01105 [Candidatus Kaiserbacteria bacterium]|nr:MAG: hypothetical protein UY93_C0002G0014 [Parcubacteria group bacterium GW2011_GWA1_56_13]KKW46301.1 MAG: hypothetical protein UY97_C0007G0012 [Parcubacteria group bacterium GW2011_GWB1_57_6]HCR52229.1 hypothetical protein [Candidatus Kaiserbacteria bacterium]